MGQRRSSNIIRFGRERGAKWTRPSDFVQASQPQSLDRPHSGGLSRRRSRGRRRRYTPLWLAAIALAVAYGAGAVRGSDPTGLFSATKRQTNHGVYYRRCADARAAGAAPIYVGQPGYRPTLDRDRDGIACEPYFGD